MDEGAQDSGSLGVMREEHLAERIEYEMRQRRWSQERLATEMTNAGHPIHQSAISKIINPKDGKRRSISVDEALGFAKVFGLPLDHLLLPLGTAQSGEARALMRRLTELIQHRIELAREEDALWQRLAELLADEAVIGRVAEGVAGGRAAPSTGIRELHAWLDQVIADSDSTTLREKGVGRGWVERARARLALYDGLIEVLSRIREPGFDLERGQGFIDRHHEDIASEWAFGTGVLALWQRRADGEEPAEHEVLSAIGWIKTSRDSLRRLLVDEDIGVP